MSELEQQIRNRREKLARLRSRGVDPYPVRVGYDLEPAEVVRRWGDAAAEDLESEAIELAVPGRLRALRSHGKTTFADLSDGRSKLQLMLRQSELGPADRALLEDLDLGDYLLATGRLMRTRTGELTLRTEALELLAKAQRPLPEKWHGLADVEARYRQRYVDLMVNAPTRRVFETRAALISGLRRRLEERGFLEVETPMMQMIPGGATARPFSTHHRALDLELYLRIAPELYLKRLLVGGLHRVFEINRNFRNEGISTRHNPEFTMLEFYQAYADYRDLMELTEELVGGLAEEVLGTSTLMFQEQEIDLSPPWRRISLRRAVAEATELEESALTDAAALQAELERRELVLPAVRDRGHLLLALFEGVVEETLIQPTFVVDFPVEVSPLAKQKPDDPTLAERFELYIGGLEIANAFSELNDPQVQAERFQTQLAARQGGDEEAHRFDADYIRALEYGMPPAGGEGLGIDRLTMLFTDQASIREVILFPLLRPESDSAASGAQEAAEEPESGA